MPRPETIFEPVRQRQILFGKLWYIHVHRLNRWMIAKDTSVYLKPNKLVVNILKTNLTMKLSARQNEVHAVGLGKEDGLLTLCVS